jgi:hypothetical protein
MASVEGDAFFPFDDLHWDDWVTTESETHESDEKNDHSYTFQIFERRDQGRHKAAI